MHVSLLHLALLVAACIGAFFAGMAYGNKIATDVRLLEQKTLGSATTELKALRGEILNFIREHTPKF